MSLVRVLLGLVGTALGCAVAALLYLLLSGTGLQLVLGEVHSRFGVETRGAQGRLWDELRLDELHYETETLRVAAYGVALDWAPLQLLRGDLIVYRIDAERLVLTPLPAPAPADAEKPFTPPQSLPVDVYLHQLRLASLQWTNGDGEPLRIETLALSGSWVGRRLRIEELAARSPWTGALALAGAAELDDDGVELETLTLRGPAHAELHGVYAWTGESDLRLDWEDLRWPLVGEPQLRSAGGTLRWQGRIEDWRYELEAALAAAGETLAIDSRGSGSATQLHAEALRVDSGAGRFDGRAVLEAGTPPQLRLSGRFEGLALQPRIPALEGVLAGSIGAEAQFGEDGPQVAFELVLADAVLQGWPLTAQARGRYADEALTLSALELRSGASRVEASGRLWPTLDAQLALDSSDLASLWPELAGQGRARLQLAGTPSQPRISGSARAEALRYDGYRAETAELEGRLDLAGDSRLQLRLRAAGPVGDGADSAAADGADAPIEQATLRLSGRPEAHRIELALGAPAAQLRLEARGALHTGKGRRWEGRLQALRIEPQRTAPWTLEAPAALRVAPPAVTAAPVCLRAEPARVCLALAPAGTGRRRVDVALENFELAALDTWLPANSQASGRVDARGYMQFGAAGLEDLRLQLDSGPLEWRRGQVPPLRFGPVQARIDARGQTLHLEAAVPLRGGAVQLDAQIAPGAEFAQRPLRGMLRIDVPDLSWLPLLHRELETVEGHVSGEIALDGVVGAPDLSGRIALRDGSARLRTPGITLEQISAALSGRAGGELRVEASARSDGGTLRVEGTAHPWAEPPALDLAVRGENFQAVRTPDAKVWVTPDLQVVLGERMLEVSGRVRVPRARISPQDLDRGVGPSSDQVITRRGEPPGGNEFALRADLRVELGDDVQFDGFGLTTALTGAVRLREAPGVPTRARGELQLVGGRYEAYGQDLTLDTGRLLFNGGTLTSPAVELRATRKPRPDITVGVLVRGTLDEPDFKLFSTPAMPQERQLSWLVLGRPLDATTGSSAERALVADAAVSLGLAGGEWLAQRFSKKLGVDEISLGAQPWESTDQARLTIGKYLSPKLFISYGVSLFQPGHTFKLQYDMGRGFKLATETGVESGGDLLYTIER